jgi:hypothetical protein
MRRLRRATARSRPSFRSAFLAGSGMEAWDMERNVCHNRL